MNRQTTRESEMLRRARMKPGYSQQQVATMAGVAADIRHRGIRRRQFERFISELEKLPEVVSEFDETLWAAWWSM